MSAALALKVALDPDSERDPTVVPRAVSRTHTPTVGAFGCTEW